MKILRNPTNNCHSFDYITKEPGRCLCSGNVFSGQNQRASWNLDNPFGGCTAGPFRQLRGGIRDVCANHCKIAVVEFQDVWASMTSRTFLSFGRRRAKSSREHIAHVIIVASPVNCTLLYSLSVPSTATRERICSNVARLLREERERQNLSLNALASKAGVSRQMVSYIEQEERNPSLDTLLRITDALDIQLDELLKRARATK
jgi:DNA-binding XRE family transcriptional regulator